MHYHEELGDGTAIGMYDGTQPHGCLPESHYLALHEAVSNREHPQTRGHRFPRTVEELPLRAIQHARIRTALISTYRIHSCKHFSGGADFPRMWEPTKTKLSLPQRFSPPGTVGYFFGLTLDAAIAEASFYANRDLEREPDPSTIILVHRTYYTDLLYLSPVLPMLWEFLRMPTMSVWDMYLALMNPDTSNPFTDTIGLWAREAGFKGIVFPSARYSDKLVVTGGAADRFPLLNFVEIGSHLCEEGVAVQLTLNALAGGLARNPPLKPPTVVYSEPNLVVFDQTAVSGLDRPVFYATYHPHEVALLRTRDDREHTKHRIMYSYGEKEITLFVNSARYKYLLRVPRSVGDNSKGRDWQTGVN
jgi:hypothetical protein